MKEHGRRPGRRRAGIDRQAKIRPDGRFLEFPGGKVEDGETPEEPARELREELGITVRVGAPFGESVCRYEQGTVHLLAYWAAWEGGETALRVHGEIRWVPGQLAG